jgi:predicted DNA-binding transcriptional regulator YafY
MRRADRLFRIVQKLRRGRLITAAALASDLEVSERTVYRDMRELMTAGLPVEGEAGLGYLLRASLDLPPLTFTRAEIEALVVGARLVRAWSGGDLATAAAQALDKIRAALPENPGAPAEALMFAPGEIPAEVGRRLDVVREAVNARRVLTIHYRDADDRTSERTVLPLGLFFWGKVWTLAAWCELREDFRHFRLDRMAAARCLPRTFEPTPGRTLEDFIAQACAEGDPPPSGIPVA